nr:ATP synthase F0 subunit 6 [Tettigometridae sp.]
MMTSLFQSFDPSSKFFNLNWMMMIFSTMLIPMNFWLKNSRVNFMKMKTHIFLMNEMKNNSHQKEILIMSKSLFMMIITNNFIGLIPYNFTTTSNLSISLSMALPLWFTLMIFGWMKFYNSMFKHLLPLGTPTLIMPMMILIETMGNMIRPLSLSIRLTANMIAGHLLMTLLGDMNNIKTIWMILPIQMFLLIFESIICIIQAYVFSTLMTLYSSEIP